MSTSPDPTSELHAPSLPPDTHKGQWLANMAAAKPDCSIAIFISLGSKAWSLPHFCLAGHIGVLLGVKSKLHLAA